MAQAPLLRLPQATFPAGIVSVVPSRLMLFNAACTSLALADAAVQLVTPAHCACTSEGNKKITNEKSGISFFIDHSRVDACRDPIVGSLSMRHYIHAWMFWAGPAFKCSRKISPHDCSKYCSEAKTRSTVPTNSLRPVQFRKLRAAEAALPELPTGRGKEHRKS